MLSKIISILSQHKKHCAIVALVIVVGLAYYTGYFESAIPGIIAGIITLLLTFIISEPHPKPDNSKETQQSDSLDATEGMNTVTTEEKNAFDMLTTGQKKLTCVIQNWSREKDIKNENGYYLSFDSKAVEPNAELTRLINEAKKYGFEYKPKEKD